MSQLIPAAAQLPDHIKARLGQQSSLGHAISEGLRGSSIPRLSIKAARFRLIEGGSEMVLKTHELEVIIVGANPGISKVWYGKQWSQDDEPAKPDCYSLDGIRPAIDATNVQNDLCASCKQNAWGSRINPQTGVKTKACQDKKRLAVVSAADPTGTIYSLQVTSTALKDLYKYQKELAVRGIPAEVVVTKLSFDPNASYPKLEFGFSRFVDADMQQEVDSLFGSNEVMEVTGETAAIAMQARQLEHRAIKAEIVQPEVEEAPPIKVEVVKAMPKSEPTPKVAPKETKRGFAAFAEEATTEKPATARRSIKEPKEAPVASSSTDIDDLIASLSNDD